MFWHFDSYGKTKELITLRSAQFYWGSALSHDSDREPAQQHWDKNPRQLNGIQPLFGLLFPPVLNCIDLKQWFMICCYIHVSYTESFIK